LGKYPGQELLLHALRAGLGVDQSFKNGQNVAAVFHQAGKDVAQSRLALRFAMPFQEHFLRNFNVAAKLFRGVSPQEQSVKKRRLPLREVEVMLRFFGRMSGGWQRRVGLRLHRA